MPPFKNRVWYISGAASGLGRATAELFHKDGAHVVLLDIQENGSEVAKALGPSRALFCHCDVTKESDVLTAIKTARDKWPNVRTAGLVNCGGLSTGELTVNRKGEPAGLDLFKKTVEVNLVGSFNLSRLVAAEMARESGMGKDLDGKSDNGLILLVGSTSSQDPQPGLSGYAASKGGVASLVLPLYQDLAAFGIRVNAIAPSLFDTAMGARVPSKARKAIEDRLVYPKRLGKAEEFSHLAKSIAENSYINGTVIRLDGGGRMSKL